MTHKRHIEFKGIELTVVYQVLVYESHFGLEIHEIYVRDSKTDIIYMLDVQLHLIEEVLENELSPRHEI